MKKFYVSKREYSSTDWHDMATVITQMEENGSFEIKEPVEFITRQIYEIIKEYKVSLDDVKEMMSQDSYRITVPEEYTEDGWNKNPDTLEFFCENDSYTVRLDYGQYVYRVTFIVRKIEEENVSYLVSEHIVNPGKGCDLTERCYSEVFNDLESANSYMDIQNKKKRHYTHSESGFKLAVVDRDYITKQLWYKMNLECVRLCDLLNENIDNYLGYRNAHALLGELQAKVYNLLDDKARFKEDVTVYQSIRDFLPSALQDKYDSCIQNNTFTREDVDKALIMAFIHAKSQEDYDAIHEALQINVTRIGQLTRHILNEHHGNGFVAVDTQGNIQWYENGYAISKWEEAKDNPYFGKLVYCMGYMGIDHFCEYKEGRFVESLPTTKEVSSWNERYREKYPNRIF